MNKITCRQLSKPMPCPGLPRLPPLRRTAEVFIYSLQSMEYFLSPSGNMRKLLRLALYLTTIAASIFPLIYITAGISSLLVQIISNLLFVALGILALIVMVNIFTAKNARHNRYR